jgi:hypothetical protein
MLQIRPDSIELNRETFIIVTKVGELLLASSFGLNKVLQLLPGLSFCLSEILDELFARLTFSLGDFLAAPRPSFTVFVSRLCLLNSVGAVLFQPFNAQG